MYIQEIYVWILVIYFSWFSLCLFTYLKSESLFTNYHLHIFVTTGHKLNDVKQLRIKTYFQGRRKEQEETPKEEQKEERKVKRRVKEDTASEQSESKTNTDEE